MGAGFGGWEPGFTEAGYNFDDMMIDILINTIAGEIAAIWNAINAVMAIMLENLIRLLVFLGRGIVYALSWIIDALSKVGESIAGVLDLFATEIIASLADFGALLARLAAVAIVFADYYGFKIYEKFKDLLNAIHFKTLLKVHQILMLVSPQYREMMKKVYEKIAKVSEAVGLGTHFITLALRNSRNLVLDLSSTFGAKYDLAEVQWLKSMKEFFDSVEGKVEGWQDDPEAFFFDLSQAIDKPAIDAKGTFMADVWITLDNILNGAIEVSDRVDTIAFDLNELISGLPEFIRDHIPIEISDAIDEARAKINDLILPKLRDLDELTSKYAKEAQEIKDRIQAAMDSILTPAETIEALEDLPEDQRDAAAETLARFTSSVTWGVAAEVKEASSDIHDAAAEAESQPWPETPEPSILTFEFDTLREPDAGPISTARSPFVGDY